MSILAEMDSLNAFDDKSHIEAEPGSYGWWTQAIGERFFRSGLEMSRVYLTCDDATITQIGRPLEAGPANFIGSLAGLIQVDDDNPFLDLAIKGGPDHFPYLGLLAAQVYVATRMGSFAGIDAAAYWDPFYKLFTKGRPFRAASLDRLDRLWLEARDFYKSKNCGLLAIQDDPKNVPYIGHRHINLPLFQALLREVDRTQIRAWLHDHSQGTGISPTQLARNLIESAPNFNKKLAHTLSDAAKTPALFVALCTLVADLAIISLPNEDFVARRTISRLRLVGLRSLSCALQTKYRSDDWIDVVTLLSDSDIRNGIRDQISGASWRGDERVAFVNGGSFVGFVSHRGSLAIDSDVILLYGSSDEEVERAVTAVETCPVALGSDLATFKAVRLEVSEADQTLLALFDCSSSADSSIRLDGGLKYEKTYLGSCPPDIHIAARTSVTVNGKHASIGHDGFAYLPRPLLAGRYVISAGNDVVTFDVVDDHQLQDSSDGEDIVYEMNRKMGIMRTARIDAVTTPKYLVGGFVGQGLA